MKKWEMAHSLDVSFDKRPGKSCKHEIMICGQWPLWVRRMLQDVAASVFGTWLVFSRSPHCQALLAAIGIDPERELDHLSQLCTTLQIQSSNLSRIQNFFLVFWLSKLCVKALVVEFLIVPDCSSTLASSSHSFPIRTCHRHCQCSLKVKIHWNTVSADSSNSNSIIVQLKASNKQLYYY